MAKEIERKYLVTDDSYKSMATHSHHIIQTYLSTSPDATVRLRIIDSRAFLTVKSRNKGCCRGEWEYEIPVSDAREMIDSCNIANNTIEKTRYYIPFDNHTWEIDEFAGRLTGLTVAEIELSTPDAPYTLPPFIGTEVTDDPRYYNSVLTTLTYPFQP